MEAYGEWHHVVTHGLFATTLVAIVCMVLAQDRWKVGLLTFLTFHLHLLCDWLGSAVDWPLMYFWPVSETFYYTPYGWPFASWQNWLVAGWRSWWQGEWRRAVAGRSRKPFCWRTWMPLS